MIGARTEGVKLPYLRKHELAEKLGISAATVRQRVGEIEASGRYDPYCVLRDGQVIEINALVFIDWLRYRRHWQDKNLRKHIPPFDAKQVAAQMGWEITKVSLRRVEI